MFVIEFGHTFDIDVLYSGDEFHNWIHDKDGYTIVQDPTTGNFCWASIEKGDLVSTGIPVHLQNPESLQLVPGLNISNDRYLEKRAKFIGLDYTRSRNIDLTIGTVQNLVVFIRFSGETEFPTSFAAYNQQLNGTGANVNSLRQYFWEASYNTLIVQSPFFPVPTGNTVISYQSPNPRSFYQPYNAVTNPNGYTDANEYTRLHDLLRAAIVSIQNLVPANLNLDVNNDGNVDNVCFIVRGNAGQWSDLLWSHRWSLWHTTNVYIHGKRVFDYNFNMENHVGDGASVIAHEFAHTLGLPDLYRYNNDGEPIGVWDLMSNNTNPPQSISAYMKATYTHWVNNIPIISANGNYTLSPSTTSHNNHAVRINSPSTSTEYFVVEYRDRPAQGIDSTIPGAGLLIYRIIPSVYGNSEGPPDEIYVYRPNGTLNNNGTIGNAHFSQQSGRTAFHSGTNPTPFLSNGQQGGLYITNIGTAGTTISFQLGDNSAFQPPTNLSSSVSGNNVTLNWQAPTGGSSSWFTHCLTNNIEDGIGIESGYPVEFIAAHRYSQAQLQSFGVSGSQLTRISFHPIHAYQGSQLPIFTVRIYTGGSGSPYNHGTLAHSQNIASYTPDVWNEITLSSPVNIPTTGELWIGIMVNQRSGGYPAGIDSGPRNEGFGNLIYIDGSWTTVYSIAPTINKNWAIKGMATTTRGEISFSGEKIIDETNEEMNKFSVFVPIEYQIAERRKDSYNENSIVLSSRNLLGYKVYRGTTLLTPSPITTLTFTNTNVPNGTHTYNVTAVYAAGESSPAFTQVNVGGGGTVTLLTETFSTSPPNGWTRATGSLSTNSIPTIHTSAGWSSYDHWSIKNFANSESHQNGLGATVNLYSTHKHWLISPTIVLQPGTIHYLSFDISLTPYNSYVQGVADPDDMIIVLISTNNGQSWSSNNTLAKWDNIGSNRVLNQIPYMGENITLNIEGYSGSVQIAFYGHSDYTVNDTEVHIDNVKVFYNTLSGEDIDIPIAKTELLGNYPNPFNPSTNISFYLRSYDFVSLDIFNIKGQKIRTLLNQYMNSGVHDINWDGKDDKGKTISSGVYFYQLNTKELSETKKMIMIK